MSNVTCLQAVLDSDNEQEDENGNQGDENSLQRTSPPNIHVGLDENVVKALKGN